MSRTIGRRKIGDHQPSYNGLQDQESLSAQEFLPVENDRRETSCANRSGKENVIDIDQDQVYIFFLSPNSQASASTMTGTKKNSSSPYTTSDHV